MNKKHLVIILLAALVLVLVFVFSGPHPSQSDVTTGIVASPIAGNYDKAQNVTLTSSTDIYYTIGNGDVSNPTCPTRSRPIVVPSGGGSSTTSPTDPGGGSNPSPGEDENPTPVNNAAAFRGWWTAEVALASGELTNLYAGPIGVERSAVIKAVNCDGEGRPFNLSTFAYQIAGKPIIINPTLSGSFPIKKLENITAVPTEETIEVSSPSVRSVAKTTVSSASHPESEAREVAPSNNSEAQSVRSELVRSLQSLLSQLQERLKLLQVRSQQ